jgi:sugar phosphate isomerase/epimerase
VTSVGARYAVCERVLRWGSFAADVALAREAGIRAIGVDHAAVDAVGSEEAALVLEGEGVEVSTYLALEDILVADGSTASRDEAARRLDVAACLGASGAVVATGPLGRRAVPDADAACREWLESSAPLAVDRGVRLL